MKTFKQFMLEAPVGAKPSFEHVNDANTIMNLLDANASSSEWMLDNDRPIWRGFFADYSVNNVEMAVVDTSATTRKSANTLNYYTLILDNNPACSDFPKRSRSFIATTSMSYAAHYAKKPKNLYAIIPFDTAKIGIINNCDIWDTIITLFGETLRIEEFNDYFSSLDIDESINSFKDFDIAVRDENGKEFKKLKRIFDNISDADIENVKSKGFLNCVYEAYSPKNTGFTWCMGSNSHQLSSLIKSEVWVGGKVAIIRSDIWKKFAGEK